MNNEDYDLRCSAEIDCPNRPCYRCLRNSQCLSFLRYRREHPEYDEKYTHYVAAHSARQKEIEEELKQRSLLRTNDREQVSMGDSRRIRVDGVGGATPRQFASTKNIYGLKGDSNMKLDFSEVQELENKQAATGTQTLVIKRAVEKKSSNGTNMLVLDCNDEEGGFVRDQVCTEGPGAFRMKNLIAALGLTADEIANMEACDFVGLTFVAEIVTEPYEGKDYSKIKKYIA